MTILNLPALARAALCAILHLAVPGAAAAPLADVHILPAAQGAGPLRVSLDHPDWTYTVGEQATITVKVDAAPYPAQGVAIRYRLGPDMLEGEERVAVVPAEGLKLAVPAPTQPGFVRCIVQAELGGKPQQATATAAFSPLAVRAVQNEPADFDRYWEGQRRSLEQVEPAYTLTPAPALSTDEVEVSYLRFQNVGTGGRPTHMYGVLSVPRKEGRYAAVLQVPGAGVRGYKGSPALAAKGYITLQIGIHGIPVNLPDEVYTQLMYGALESYDRYNLDDRERYYYRRVYLGVLRALDYLVQHPKWDGRHLAAQGGSQGGQLAIMASALHPKVSLTLASYPAYSDVTGYLHGRAGGWPGLFRMDAKGARKDQPVEPKAATSAYYDTVNFARRLHAPVLYYAGYNDVTTPPTSTFAAYNAIPTARTLIVEPQQTHSTSAAHRATMDQWLLKHALEP